MSKSLSQSAVKTIRPTKVRASVGSSSRDLGEADAQRLCPGASVAAAGASNTWREREIGLFIFLLWGVRKSQFDRAGR